jgi:hypothetical protein
MNPSTTVRANAARLLTFVDVSMWASPIRAPLPGSKGPLGHHQKALISDACLKPLVPAVTTSLNCFHSRRTSISRFRFQALHLFKYVFLTTDKINGSPFDHYQHNLVNPLRPKELPLFSMSLLRLVQFYTVSRRSFGRANTVFFEPTMPFRHIGKSTGVEDERIRTHHKSQWGPKLTIFVNRGVTYSHALAGPKTSVRSRADQRSASAARSAASSGKPSSK